MKSRRKRSALADQHRLAAVRTEHLDICSAFLNSRCTDEHTVELTESGVDVGFETVDLTTIRITANFDVDGTETSLIVATVKD